MNIYKSYFRPILFKVNPETIHHFVFKTLKFVFKIPGAAFFAKSLFVNKNKKLERTVFGIRFPNPVGLAAGMDKNAHLYEEFIAMGFGFVEIGTVTPLPQPGNEKPRMFRLPQDAAIINRMGFNNDGVEVVANRLRKKNATLIVGGNIGKNKITENSKAIDDYEVCFRVLFSSVNYFAVNVSSPNTPGLRSLQDKGPLLEILLRLQNLNAVLAIQYNCTRKPILLKIAPDLTIDQLDEIIEVVLESKIDGVIATNTTVSRENLKSDKKEIEFAGSGGLSGKPLGKRSTEVIRYLSGKSGGKFKIIGVGGIHSADDALEKLNAGADLIQLYTGFIYEGPSLIKDINKALLAKT